MFRLLSMMNARITSMGEFAVRVAGITTVFDGAPGVLGWGDGRGGGGGGGGGVKDEEDEEDEDEEDEEDEDEEDEEDDDARAMPLFIASNMASPISLAVGDGGRLAIIFSISLAVAGWGKPVIIA